MQFNDTTGKQGIVQDVYFEVNANSSTYPIADLVRNANVALDNVVTIALEADGQWDFDSTNATDFPIGLTDLMSGQQDYEFDDEFLVIRSVEVCDSNGKWSKIVPIDIYMMEKRQSMTDFEEENGIPLYYDKIGNSMFLYPAPNYNRRLVEEGEAGLKVYFQRKMDYFDVSDTVKEAGMPKHLQKYIPLYCSYAYAAAKDLPKVSTLEKRLEFYTGNKLRGGNDGGAIEKHYSKREKDVQQQITLETVNSI